MTREQLCRKLHQEEQFYLCNRGWTRLWGFNEPSWLKPGTPRQLKNGEIISEHYFHIGERYFHNEAVKIQKEIDQQFSDARSKVLEFVIDAPEIFYPKRCKDLAWNFGTIDTNAAGPLYGRADNLFE